MGCKQLRRLLECTEDNFLVQALDKPSRREALLDLVLTNAEIIEELKTEGSLGCSNHALVEFMISRIKDWQKAKSRS